MAAVQTAAANIRAGMDTVVDRRRHREHHAVAAGVQEAARAVLRACSRGCRRAIPTTPDAPTMDMSITVGWNTAQKCNVTREEQDHWAYHSHLRAIAATDEGRLKDEIFAVEVPAGKGETRDLRRRRAPAPRHDDGEARLAAAAAPRDPRVLDHRGQLVGPQRRIVRGRRLRRRLRARPRPRAARDHPLVGVGRRCRPPTPASARRSRSRRRCSAPGCSVDDIELVEINEAFASMAVASSRILGFPHEIVNVNGSGCSLGHPVACTGARMITTLIYELRRRGGGIRRREHVRRRRHGLGDGHRGAPRPGSAVAATYIAAHRRRLRLLTSRSRSSWPTPPTRSRAAGSGPTTSSSRPSPISRRSPRPTARSRRRCASAWPRPPAARRHRRRGDGASDGSSGSERRWIVDPIDGTKNYVRGVPVWATLLALEVDGRDRRRRRVGTGARSPVVGRRGAAARSRTASAIHVSRVHDARRRASLPRRRRSASGSARVSASAIDALARAVLAHRRGFGDFWGHMLVAEGAADAMVEPVLALWDVAALRPDRRARPAGASPTSPASGWADGARDGHHERPAARRRARGARRTRPECRRGGARDPPEVTVGIDIGTSSVKAIAADGDGNVVASARVPHGFRIPTPERFEHDAERRVAARARAKRSPRLGDLDVRGVSVAAMVPSLTAVDARRGAARARASSTATSAAAPPAPAMAGAATPRAGELLGFLRWARAEAPGRARVLARAGRRQPRALRRGDPRHDDRGDRPTRCSTGPAGTPEGGGGVGDRRRAAPAPRADGLGGGRVASTATARRSPVGLHRRAGRAAGRRGRRRRRRPRHPRHDAHHLGGRAATSVTVPGLHGRSRTRRAGKYLVGGPSNAGGLFCNWAGGLLGRAIRTRHGRAAPRPGVGALPAG